jgi:D-serine deaminase-like pyridoxal phosphate-dependent protein
MMLSTASAHAPVCQSLESLETPCLILETSRLVRNVSRLKRHLEPLGVRLRPHLKTAKSADVARLVMDGGGPLTISTLREAEYFLAHGFSDLLYAVGIAPNKLDHVFDLRRRGAGLSIMLDNIEMARLVAARCAERGDRLPVMIEIDTDGHRSGIKPYEPALVEVGRTLHEGGAVLAGVVTHAGSSYGLQGSAAFADLADQERSGIVAAAEMLRGAGLPCPVVSVGSTPTAHFARDLAGVTEVRAGVFMFFDLVMAGIGVCSLGDIAISVLASVIGHQQDKGWILVDAGWMAMSRDRGTARLAVDQGYGVVCDLACNPMADLIVIDANQEHGIIADRSGRAPPNLPVGTMLRILPNHACATAAQHDRYHVINDGSIVSAIWPRIYGW